MEELGWFPFKNVADELQDPARHEENGSQNPKPMKKESGQKNREGCKDYGNPKGVAKPVDGVLMTALVARNPLLTAIRAQHGARK